MDYSEENTLSEALWNLKESAANTTNITSSSTATKVANVSSTLPLLLVPSYVSYSSNIYIFSPSFCLDSHSTTYAEQEPSRETVTNEPHRELSLPEKIIRSTKDDRDQHYNSLFEKNGHQI